MLQFKWFVIGYLTAMAKVCVILWLVNRDDGYRWW